MSVPGTGLSAPYLCAEGVELVAGPPLPPARLLQAIQERALLGKHQPRVLTVGAELARGARARRHALIRRQHGRVDDPLAGDDVAVHGLEGQNRAALPAAGDLPAADAEVELVLRAGTREPPGFRGGIRPGREHPLR